MKYKRYPSDGGDVALAKESQELIILTELKLVILQIHLPVRLSRIPLFVPPKVSMYVGKPDALHNGL